MDKINNNLITPDKVSDKTTQFRTQDGDVDLLSMLKCNFNIAKM